MVNFYVSRILAGKMEIEQVPPRWREQVREALGPKGIRDMTKAELLAYCEEHGIQVNGSMTKAEIIALIEERA